MESGSPLEPQTIFRQTHSESPLVPTAYAKTFTELGERAFTLLKEGGLDASAPSAQALQEFSKLTLQRQVHILNDLRVFCDLGSERVSEKKGFSREAEIDHFCRFLHHNRLRLPSDDFLDLINDGDLIEIYDVRCTQIYRSWTFFKVCSYSLTDLSVYPFDMLYERPSWVLGKLIELVPLVLSTDLPIIDFQAKGIREYPLRERLPGHNYMNLFQMKYCTGLLSEGSRAPEAFVSTGFAQRLPEGMSRSLRFV